MFCLANRRRITGRKIYGHAPSLDAAAKAAFRAKYGRWQRERA
jgi:hypothetical protein